MLNLATLNPEQRQAVETIQGPVLILAGAGTGKTRVITFRMARMIERGIPPGSILGVTFTNKAAREMRARVAKLIPRARGGDSSESDARPVIGTFHSLGARILREHIHLLGYKSNFVIYDETEQLGALKRILSRISGREAKTDPAEVLAWLSRYRNGAGGAATAENAGARAMAEHVREKYEGALRACNAVDFDGLILLTLRILEEFPAALEACRSRFRYVMVDEYQDTNASQFKLVSLLTAQHRNLCVVGDDDQSIYGWRGADIANLLDMEKHYPEVKVVKLEQNYRSTNVILKAANALIKNNLRRRGKRLWSRKGEGAKILLQACKDEEEEAQSIVERLEFARVASRVPWSDQAILFRTNQQSRALETALRKASVRYHLIGGQSYFDRREIKDFLAYLKLILNPDDDTSLLRVANVPSRGLSDPTMERIIAASAERQCSVYRALQHTDVAALFPQRTRQSMAAFASFIEAQRTGLAAEGPGSLRAWADRFIDLTGYPEELARLEKNPEEAGNRLRNIRDLTATMDRTTAGSGLPAARLESFLEGIALESDFASEKEDAGDAVTLITMHSCKGLEFPHVSIAGLEDGLLPHSRSKVEGTMDEERRLFYVALTRAMQTLFLSHCGGRKRYGKLLPCHPSPFLSELPEDLVENVDETSGKPVALDTGKNFFSAMRSSIG
jgi:superfamily I DNA/RNA helicase